IVSDPASPNMSMTDFYNHIGSIIKYPKEAKKKGIEGKVFVEFIINKKGEVTQLKVLKGIGSGCDNAALEAMQNVEDWNPAKHNGKIVSQKIVLPINFELGENIKEEEIFTIVSDPASPNMSMSEFYIHIGSLINYPKEAEEKGIEGKVFVEFIIDKKGKVTQLKVLKGIGSGCDNVAIEAMQNAGDWNPAKHNGILVSQKIVLPIEFNLGKNK
ncbi:MAG: energy transducer TonB, partial [Cyclobacteriaceae bacterium]|nr:energy transducer TonB [Cyclobacteriaceae bacterium]